MVWPRLPRERLGSVIHLWVFMSKNSTLEVLPLLVSTPPETTTPGLPFRVTEVQPWLVLGKFIPGTENQLLVERTSFMTECSSPSPPITITWVPSWGSLLTTVQWFLVARGKLHWGTFCQPILGLLGSKISTDVTG